MCLPGWALAGCGHPWAPKLPGLGWLDHTVPALFGVRAAQTPFLTLGSTRPPLFPGQARDSYIMIRSELRRHLVPVITPDVLCRHWACELLGSSSLSPSQPFSLAIHTAFSLPLTHQLLVNWLREMQQFVQAHVASGL